MRCLGLNIATVASTGTVLRQRFLSRYKWRCHLATTNSFSEGNELVWRSVARCQRWGILRDVFFVRGRYLRSCGRQWKSESSIL